MNQSAKAAQFKAMHEAPGLFLLPNPWDAGSARILASLGFKALATTSAGLSFMLGKPDGKKAIGLDDALANASMIVEATTLPVAGDLENGYGDAPEDCANSILKSAAAGLVGCSIEDSTGDPKNPIYEFELAVARVKAAVKAARSLSFPFMFAARCENFLHGKPDITDTIRRLVAFAESGADVLYAPGLKTIDEIKAVVKAVSPKPVNVLAALSGNQFSIKELEEAGVKRVSVGSSLARAAYSKTYDIGKAMAAGDFSSTLSSLNYDQLNELFS